MTKDNKQTDSLGLNKEVEEYLNANFSFRYNEITGKTEYKNAGETSFKDLTDYWVNSLIRQFAINNIRCTDTKIRSLLCSDFVPTYNPVHDYLKKLPVHDESTDHIQALSSTLQTTNQLLWQKCLNKWLVAWVASMLNEDKVNHTVIVLSGGQGIGKSSWLSRLVPSPLRKYVFAGTINPDSKDTLIFLSECILINLDEFENLNRNQIGRIKELITKENVKIRRPYGHNAENLPRRASFVASVNKHEFLTDVTGNRRFLCFEAINIDYQHEIDMDLVFAQALFLYQQGYRYWLDKDDIDEINASNEKFRALSLEEEALLTHYEPSNERELMLTTTEILSRLSSFTKIPVNTASGKRLGEALKKNGFQRVKTGGIYAYCLREKQILSTPSIRMDHKKPAA